MGYAINSGIGTKSCAYDFSKDGGLGVGVFSYAGISLKPGEALVDIKATILTPLAGPVGARLQMVSNVFLVYDDNIAVYNTKINSLYADTAQITAFKNTQSGRIPFNLNLSQPFRFTSTGLLTAGKVAFIVTYQYTRF